MLKQIFTFLLFLMAVAGPLDGAAADVDREEAMALTATVGDGVADAVSQVFFGPRAAYLDGYGLVVTIEVGLVPPRNPFSSPRTPEEVRRDSRGRLESLKSAVPELLSRPVADLEGLGADEFVGVVIHLVNANPVDLPDLPEQLVFSVRKQDATARASGALTEAAFRQRVTIREQ
jgi:hypothetical protein